MNVGNVLLILRLPGGFQKIKLMPNFPRLALVVLGAASFCSPAWTQQLDCQPCNDHYGRVQIGTPIQRLIQLTNIGKKSLKITAKSISGAAFTIGNFPLPVTLGPGLGVKLPITFTPVVAGINRGTISLNNTGTNPQFIINLQGVGVLNGIAHLTVSPASLDFGNVTVGSGSNLSVTLSASGAPVTISAAQTNNLEFTLPGLVLPLTIQVGKSATMVVLFTPVLAGTASGSVTLTSNADDSPTGVSLTGVGVVAGPHSADLTWDASQDPVIGYNVYRGATSGGPYTQINPVLDASTSYTDTTVQAGATYYYVATAVNSDNQESAPSNEVKVLIPSP